VTPGEFLRRIGHGLTISLPDEILRKAEELTAQERISLEELVVTALSEQFAGIEYLRRRGSGLATRGSEQVWIGFPMLNLNLTTG
jgi:hypothetical protein